MKVDKLIINTAITGMITTKKDNPNLPVTPDEIAAESEKCCKSGASIFHLHARDKEGKPAYQSEIYQDIIRRVKQRCPGVIICVSCSGRVHNTFEKRSDVLNLEGDFKPDMASLTLGSLNFPKQASVSDPGTIRSLAEKMDERGIIPELEVFDFGMLDYAKYLIGKGVLKAPFYFNLLLGSLGTLSATPYHLAALVQELPAGAVWAGAGIGRFQFPVNSLAVIMGGHVRIGLEDNIYMDPDKEHLATNVTLIERIVRLSEAAGREICTPQEAREIIGLT